MASRAHRRIHEESPALRREQLDDLAHENGRVWRSLNVARPHFDVVFPVSRLTSHVSRVTTALSRARRSPRR
jgi:hypothetical protein